MRVLSILVSAAAILATATVYATPLYEDVARTAYGPTPPEYLPTPPEVLQPLEEVTVPKLILASCTVKREEPVLPEVVTLRVKVTGYSPYDAIDSEYHKKYPDTKTADMTDWRTTPYGVACDQFFLPFGSRVRVPGYMDKSYPDAFWTVDDTGGRLRQSWRLHATPHLDVRFKTEWSAIRWGTRWLDIEIDLSSVSEPVRKRLKRLAKADTL